MFVRYQSVGCQYMDDLFCGRLPWVILLSGLGGESLGPRIRLRLWGFFLFLTICQLDDVRGVHVPRQAIRPLDDVVPST